MAVGMLTNTTKPDELTDKAAQPLTGLERRMRQTSWLLPDACSSGLPLVLYLRMDRTREAVSNY